MLWSVLFVFWLSLVNADVFHVTELDAVAADLPGGIIRITNSDLRILSRPNRDHFTLLVLTSTDSRHECDLCADLKRILARVAWIWGQNYPGSQYLYIAEVDIVDRTNVDVFKYLGLQDIPHVWLIPPSHITNLHDQPRERRFDEHGQEYFDNFDILHEAHSQFELPNDSFDTQVFKMADWLAENMQKRIIVKQENAMAKFATTFAATFLSILLLKKKGPDFLTKTVTKGRVYQVMLLAMILGILGGYSFTTIKGVPFVAKNDKGEPIYISGGLHYQFGVEILLVGLHYFLLAATFVVLVYLGNYRVESESLIRSKETQAILQLFTAGVLYLFFSSFTSMFLRKVSDYPYGLVKLF